MDEFMSKALYVEDVTEDVDFSTAPSSGEEYLKRVILEARKCEPVVVARVDRRKFKAQTVRYSDDTGVLKAPEGCAPSREWQHQQIALFSELRNRLVRHHARLKRGGTSVKSPVTLPDIGNEEAWTKFLYGSDNGNRQGTPPLLPIVLSLNQFKVETLLEYNVGWLDGKSMELDRGRWFYALLARLEKPLKPEMCSVLRSLARCCSRFRNLISSPEDSLLPQLNLFICIVGRYFDQTDLADEL